MNLRNYTQTQWKSAINWRARSLRGDTHENLLCTTFVIKEHKMKIILSTHYQVEIISIRIKWIIIDKTKSLLWSQQK
jgi:hypothetical protein